MGRGPINTVVKPSHWASKWRKLRCKTPRPVAGSEKALTSKSKRNVLLKLPYEPQDRWLRSHPCRMLHGLWRLVQALEFYLFSMLPVGHGQDHLCHSVVKHWHPRVKAKATSPCQASREINSPVGTVAMLVSLRCGVAVICRSWVYLWQRELLQDWLMERTTVVKVGLSVLKYQVVSRTNAAAITRLWASWASTQGVPYWSLAGFEMK